ncbi:hypothetical protein ACNFJ7_01690 [Sphingomonas sp. HT-1]|uniref:hypothetical protein n=1 Tax=unclassified Sphingomonas TaxID=196159 RepID=UPI00031B0D54|nr:MULTISPECIES: hypothetical protein [unclassified Sphingomonas]KTF68075.1 hypothetical protein ATB93_15320 [Sphingomonas sp. WG]
MLLAAALLTTAPCVAAGTGGKVAADLLRTRLAEQQAPCAQVLLAPLPSVEAALPANRRAMWRKAAPRALPREGFAVRRIGDTLVITARGTRGLVYGAGWYLRTGARPQRYQSAPARQVRLTQIGYRAKNNSYDAWTLAMFRRRIEDFALWGASGVQVIAPISDDDATSPLFPAPPLETLRGIGEIAHRLGIDFALYYPNLHDYATHAERAEEVARFRTLLNQLPIVDALYIPGGDPGHAAPANLFPLVAEQAAALRARNPAASVWISTQGFDAAGLDAFYAQLARRPGWLTGIFAGPQTRDPVAVQRRHLPHGYQLLLYPDIAHTMHAQVPVDRWSPAFALTQGREPINPRPQAMAALFRHLDPGSSGFVTYSEGVNDDVNQFHWFRLGWDPQVTPTAFAADYGRAFIGDPAAARAILALERNWEGDPAANATIDATLALIDRLKPASWADWRMDALHYRAVYDAIVRHRLIAARARETAALSAVDGATARARLAEPDPAPVQALRARLFALADRLWQGARLQLSVKRYGASNIERGANLDRVDVDLNDRVWIERQLATRTPTQLADHARTREGALYDDLGDPWNAPHLVRGSSPAADPLRFQGAIEGIADRTPNQGWRMSWISYAESLYDAPLRLRYTGLDRKRRYRLVATYAGEDYWLPMRLVANGSIELHPPLDRATNPMTVELAIPHAATRGGTLDLAWTRPPGMGGSGRGHQVAETWLIPEPLAGERK